MLFSIWPVGLSREYDVPTTFNGEYRKLEGVFPRVLRRLGDLYLWFWPSVVYIRIYTQDRFFAKIAWFSWIFLLYVKELLFMSKNAMFDFGLFATARTVVPRDWGQKLFVCLFVCLCLCLCVRLFVCLFVCLIDCICLFLNCLLAQLSCRITKKSNGPVKDKMTNGCR
jgi:hypothetical protein